MPIQDPSEAARAFGEAFNSGDINGLLALYEPSAVLVPEPGKQVSGTDALRIALEGFLALKGEMTIESRSVVVTNDFALTRQAWNLKGMGPDGASLELGGESAEVWRRQPNGDWLLIIDNPWG
jgi:ketosteroid isomerase-like protein